MPEDKRIENIPVIEHIEELYHIISNLNEKQTEKLISNIKSSKISSSDKKIQGLIEKSKNTKELLDTLKKELSSSLQEEYINLKNRLEKIIKKGVNYKEEELIIMRIPSKIRMFSATLERKDYLKVKSLIFSLEEKIEEKLKTV